MKYFKHKKILLAIVAVLLVGTLAAAYAFTRPNYEAVTPATPTDKEVANSNDPTTNSSKPKEGITKNQVAPPTSQPKSTDSTNIQTSTTSVFISWLSQASGNIELRAVITGSSSGTCMLTLSSTNDDSTVKRQSDVIPDATSSLCSFSVPVSELAIGGKWVASLIVNNSAPATKPFEVTK